MGRFFIKRRYSHRQTTPKRTETVDHGKDPFVVDIENATINNDNFRTTIWTGTYLQSTLMKLKVGEDIGLEIHPHTDQFLRIEKGNGIVEMGSTQNNLSFKKSVADGDAIFVPAGTWHNLTNVGKNPLHLYSIYAPPHHMPGTVHPTKEDAMEEEF